MEISVLILSCVILGLNPVLKKVKVWFMVVLPVLHYIYMYIYLNHDL